MAGQTGAGQGWDEVLRGAVKGLVENTFARCGADGCKRRSPGEWAVCHSCARRCCLTHGYLTLEAPPQVVCSACIVAEAATVAASDAASGRGTGRGTGRGGKPR